MLSIEAKYAYVDRWRLTNMIPLYTNVVVATHVTIVDDVPKNRQSHHTLTRSRIFEVTLNLYFLSRRRLRI